VQQWTSSPQSFEQTGKGVPIAFQGKKVIMSLVLKDMNSSVDEKKMKNGENIYSK
jgi:hypothetical protein